jgi:Leucine-rich repeat (LRR) protein
MKIILLAFILMTGFHLKSVAQDTTGVVSLNYEEFSNRFKSGGFKDADTIQLLIIRNSNRQIFHPAHAANMDLPIGGIYFDYVSQLSQFKNLKELRLIDLFIKELPENFAELDKLETLELCFSGTADIKKNLNVLKRLKSLKYLDLNGSRLSSKQRIMIRKKLSEKGVKVDDVVYL